jgi:hypothetical protein
MLYIVLVFHSSSDSSRLKAFGHDLLLILIALRSAASEQAAFDLWSILFRIPADSEVKSTIKVLNEVRQAE